MIDREAIDAKRKAMEETWIDPDSRFGATPQPKGKQRSIGSSASASAIARWERERLALVESPCVKSKNGLHHWNAIGKDAQGIDRSRCAACRRSVQIPVAILRDNRPVYKLPDPGAEPFNTLTD